MHQPELKTWMAGLAVAAPGLLLGFGLLPGAWLNRNPQRAAAAGARVAEAAALAALLALLLQGWAGPVHHVFGPAGPVHLGVCYDRLSAILLLLIAFLLAIVVNYSQAYLAGDPGHGRFTKWLCFTGGAALGIVVAGNLLQLALAWSVTSLGLHQLLVFYPDRPGARLAARKKFLISRLGDLCLLGCLLLAWRQFQTWDFDEMFTRARALAPGHPGLAVNVMGFLLVAGAMMKSAQFPFHSWLPDTMETPTPVSALMHAGIINAGGFLVIRLSPVVELSPLALATLAVFGAFTAWFASLVMLTHASIKRSLAFSTVAQMGFMMLECGLGAFSLAVLHLVAHSLYKGHAFLSSGTVTSPAPSRAEVRAGAPIQPLVFWTAVAVALCLMAGLTILLPAPFQTMSSVLTNGCFTLALAWWLALTWGGRGNWRRFLAGLVGGITLAVTYGGLHVLFDQLLDLPQTAGPRPWSGLTWVPAGLLVLFVGTFWLQSDLDRLNRQPFFQTLYVHARNGFYFTTLANRLVASLWPLKPARSRQN